MWHDKKKNKKTFSLVQQTFEKSVDLILKTVTFSFQIYNCPVTDVGLWRDFT